MKTNEGKVIGTGGWPSNPGNCPDSPRQLKKHFFEDKSSRPSAKRGERLVTSECRYCGAIIKDCPTIGA